MAKEETPLDNLDLSAQAHYPVRACGYKTVEQIAALSEGELLAIPWLDQELVAEIQTKLQTYVSASQQPGETEPKPESHHDKEFHPAPQARQAKKEPLRAVHEEKVRAEGFQWNAITVSSFREHVGLPQRDLAEYLGIPEQTLRKWEKGITQPEGAARTQLTIMAKWMGTPYGMVVGDTPLRVLELSTRTENALSRAGYVTVEQIAVLNDQELLDVRQIGQKGLAEIKEKLRAYLPNYLVLSSEFVDKSHRKEPQLPRPNLSGKRVLRQGDTPLEELGLSTRAYNCLRRSGYATLGEIAALNDYELLAIPNLGEKSLAEIKKSLKPYRQESSQTEQSIFSSEEPQGFPLRVDEKYKLLPPPPVAALGLLDLAEKRKVPLNTIFIERLDLPKELHQLLESRGIETIADLAQEPYDSWKGKKVVKQRLDQYLTWLVEQDEWVWTEEIAGENITLFQRLALDRSTLEQLLHSWMKGLRARQRRIIEWRYGLYGDPLTLREISERHLDVTRERVRQIQVAAEEELGRPYRMKQVRSLVALLKHLVKEAGGLMNESQIQAALDRELTIGAVDPVGVVRLIDNFSVDFKWFRQTEAWGLSRYSFDMIDEVQKRIVRGLERGYAPLPLEKLVTEFKTSEFYRNHEGRLTDPFIIACIRVHPELLADEDDLFGLEKWESRRTDEIVLILREIGEAVHYSDVAEKTNSLLDPEMRTSAHNIHAILGRRADLFVRVGHGIYGLKEWGLPDDGSVANAAHRVLTEAGKPLHYEAITDRVLETWKVNRSSVYQALNNDPRFIHIGPGMYWLRDHLSEHESSTREVDFGDLYGERLARWQEELDERGMEDVNTHEEVDIIREIGTDFFSD